MRYFVTGIEENVGKTVVSSILVQALSANYWKPIESDTLDRTTVAELISKKINFYPESYRFATETPLFLATKKEGIASLLKNIVPPSSTHLIIEGTGGVMTPLDDKGTYTSSILPFCDAEVILVLKNVNTSLSHTLLAIHYLQTKNYSIKGIIVTGELSEEIETLITKNTGVPILFHVPITSELTKAFIKEQAIKLRSLLADHTTAHRSIS